jgi:ABC-type multidrug transport system fused ATPase/permease subunit
MDDGEVTEVGTHAELLNNGGQYEKLYTIQSKE